MDWKKIHQFPKIQMLNRFGNSVAMTESTQPRLRGTRRSPLKDGKARRNDQLDAITCPGEGKR